MQMSPITKKLGHRQSPMATPEKSPPRQPPPSPPHLTKAALFATCVALRPHSCDAAPALNKFSACPVTTCITDIRGGQLTSGRPCQIRPLPLPPRHRHNRPSDRPYYHPRLRKLSSPSRHPGRICAKAQRPTHRSPCARTGLCLT